MGKANLPTVAEAIELLGYWRTPTDDKRRVQAANVLADAHLETVDRTSLRARIAALEAEVAQLRSGIHPPVNPMPGGFSLENFMPGLKPEDADAFCKALDAASPDLSEKQGTFSDKIAALEARLAEEARVRGLLVEALGRAYYYLPEPTTIEEAERGGRPIHFAVSRALAAADAMDKERG